MLTVMCVVVGEGTPFPIDIAADQSVGHLKNKIKGEINYDGNAKDLELYLAKTGGAWLDTDGAKAVALDEDGKVPDFDVMNPTYSLSNPECIGANFERKDGDIHVLVVVPEGVPGNVNQLRIAEDFDGGRLTEITTGKRPIEKIGEIVEASVHKAMRDSAEKVSVHSLSTMDSLKKHLLLRKMALKVTAIGMEEPSDTSIPVFKWNEELAENQENQRAQYMAYLETHLKTLLDKFTLKHIANNKSILNTVDPRLPFVINGTADVLLIVKSKAINVIPLSGLCLVIELKKKVESCHLSQAIGQLVCASIKTPHNCSPMSLLTDLNDTWVFSYFSDKNVLTHIEFHYPKNAIDFIKATVEEQAEHATPHLPYMSAPFKKMRVDDFLPRPVDGHAAEMMENFELMADELEPEFLMSKRIEYAQNLVQSMPMYAHMYS